MRSIVSLPGSGLPGLTVRGRASATIKNTGAPSTRYSSSEGNSLQGWVCPDHSFAVALMSHYGARKGDNGPSMPAPASCSPVDELPNCNVDSRCICPNCCRLSGRASPVTARHLHRGPHVLAAAKGEPRAGAPHFTTSAVAPATSAAQCVPGALHCVAL